MTGMGEIEDREVAAKTPTGIAGFDRLSGGGLPLRRISAVVGSAGAGKTVFALQSMINLVRDGGHGMFVSFEQSPQSIRQGALAFGWGAREVLDSGRFHILDARLRSEVVLCGGFDLAGLLASAGSVIPPDEDSVMVFDGIDALLSVLERTSTRRGELLRIQEYAEQRPVTVMLTLKLKSDHSDGVEDIAEYIADCVIELERGTEDGLANRGLRIQKYRGSPHGQSRVPFIITEDGIEIAAIESEPTPPAVSTDRTSTGVARLDDMMGGGLFRASSTLLSGSPGTAKTTLGTRFLEAGCGAGERALGIFFDESPEEVVRNVASVSTDLKPHLASGLLRMHGMVNRSAGPDEFAHEIATQVYLHRPRHLLIDPISVFNHGLGAQNAVRRLVQLCKSEGITVMMTSLLERNAMEAESTRSYVSSLCDNWIHLSYLVQAGERNRGLTIVKSRGTAHSNQVGELLLSDSGITIAEAFTEDGAVLMGSLRWQKERANELAVRASRAEAERAEREAARKIEELERRRAAIDVEIGECRQDLHRLRFQEDEGMRMEIERRDRMFARRSSTPAVPDGEAE